MERLVSLNVPNLDSGTGGDIRDIVIVPVGVWVTVCRSVHNAEVIVVITVRIEGDLLLYMGVNSIKSSRRIREYMRNVRMDPPGYVLA